MGGLMFEDTVRLDGQALLRVYEIVKNVVHGMKSNRDETIPIGHVGMPPEILDKESFGDVDLHFCFGETEDSVRLDELREKLMEALGCEERFKVQGDCSCFLTKERYQVDFHIYTKEEFGLSMAIKAHGDFCWIVGLSLRKFGLKMNEAGLMIRREAFEPPLQTDFVVSTDVNEIADFLGIPRVVFDGETRFTYEQLFPMLCRAHFFRKEHLTAYLAKDTCESRRRSNRRPMLHQFREFVANCMEELATQNSELDTPEIATKQAAMFFGKLKVLETAMTETEKVRVERLFKSKCKSLLSGKIIMEREPTLTGAQVGECLKTIMQNLGQDSYVVLYKRLEATTLEQREAIIDNTIKSIFA